MPLKVILAIFNNRSSNLIHSDCLFIGIPDQK